MIDSPFETKSDSFYFVNGNLIMHNKASYKVSCEIQWREKYQEKYLDTVGNMGWCTTIKKRRNVYG